MMAAARNCEEREKAGSLRLMLKMRDKAAFLKVSAGKVVFCTSVSVM